MAEVVAALHPLRCTRLIPPDAHDHPVEVSFSVARVCHENVRTMENIKKCQCKRLAKVGKLKYFLKYYLCSMNSNIELKYCLKSWICFMDFKNVQARFDYFTDGKQGPRHGFKMLQNGGVSRRRQAATGRQLLAGGMPVSQVTPEALNMMEEDPRPGLRKRSRISEQEVELAEGAQQEASESTKVVQERWRNSSHC